jgi:2-iminobutanoate/2-iminopropanoate deaminase
MQAMSATLSFAIGLLAATAGAVLAARAEEPSMQFYHSPGAVAAKLPFSQAVRVGDVLYLSGALGNVPGTRQVVAGGIEAETRQTMENIGTVLKANGLSFDDVFKCTVMLADMAKWEDFNKVYVAYFKPDRLPARSAFGASGLALGAQVELECMAYAGKSDLRIR